MTVAIQPNRSAVIPVSAVLGIALLAGGCGLQPVVDAGIDVSVYEGQEVQLSARNGSAAALADFIWEQLQGPPVALQSANSSIARFVAPPLEAEARLVFRVTAFSSLGIISLPVFGDAFDVSSELNLPVSDEVVVTVMPNPVPQVNAGEDLTVAPGDHVILAGSASAGVSHINLTVSWHQAVGPAVTLSGATTTIASFTAPLVDEDTSLIFELTAEAEEGNSNTDWLSVLVTPAAAIPTANAGPDQVVDSLSDVMLDASASSDPLGGDLTYQWEQIDGPTVGLTPSSTIARPIFTAPSVSTAALLSFKVTVTTEHNSSDEDMIHIIVLQAE